MLVVLGCGTGTSPTHAVAPMECHPTVPEPYNVKLSHQSPGRATGGGGDTYSPESPLLFPTAPTDTIVTSFLPS